MQVQNLVRQQYPGVEFVPCNFPPAPVNLALGKLCGYAQMALIALAVAGDKICEMLDMKTPDFYERVKQNKFGYVMAVWFVGNAITNSLLSTGAFEIFYDGHLVFSKIAQGRMPFPEEVMSIMSSKSRPRQPVELTYD